MTSDQEALHSAVNSLAKLYGEQKFNQLVAAAAPLLKEFPESSDLLNLLGSAYIGLRHFEAAIDCFNKAISYRPDLEKLYVNLGTAYKFNGQLDEAVSNYQFAIEKNPAYAMAYYNLGTVHFLRGDTDSALDCFARTVSLAPDYQDAYRNAGAILRNKRFDSPAPQLVPLFVAMLDNACCVRPSDVVRSALSLLSQDSKLSPLLGRDLEDSIENSLAEILRELSGKPLVTRLLETTPIPALEFERLFSAIREAVLLQLDSLPDSEEILSFLAALASQCFVNEYVYPESEQEAALVSDLLTLVLDRPDIGDRRSAMQMLCLACYRDLSVLDWQDKPVSEPNCRGVYQLHVIEKMKEIELMHGISSYCEISDRVSVKVRKQYEERPYPRWIKANIEERGFSVPQLVDSARLKLADASIREIQTPRILIAGCGTGRNAIETASRINQSSVLAIDLSLSSLSYGKRKTLELGIDNIEYLQGDILEVQQLDQQFDVIECGGVLHHMADPYQGLECLTAVLKPGGLLKLGLYSELSRAHIVQLRREIEALGIGASAQEIRAFRQRCMRSDNAVHKLACQSSDFYSLSSVRDLLFHVQEHRFEIPLIAKYLKNLGLKFCGFEFANPGAIRAFEKVWPDESALYDLDKWWEFEKRNPTLFQRMYQFWCQKV